MGLLLGGVAPVAARSASGTPSSSSLSSLSSSSSPQRVSIVWAATALQRSDRRPDRVEISPEQLANGAMLAERLALDSGRPTRVLGWYHSHPHITVSPSHVDVGTQKMWQSMDEDFVGLIFSVFNGASLQLTAFQTGRDGERTHVPIHVAQPPPFASSSWREIVNIYAMSLKEDRDAYRHAQQTEASSADAPAAHGAAAANASPFMLQEETQQANAAAPAVSPFKAVHDGGLFQASLARVSEYGLGPLRAAMDARALRETRKREDLERRREAAERVLKECA